MARQILGIIPARYASTRFPGKPLIDLGGKSMITRVYEQCKAATMLTDVVVATDDARIADHLVAKNIPFVMTAEHHPSGTDRCQEAYQNYGKTVDYVINIQGDEPFISPETIDTLAGLCVHGTTEIATLVKPLTAYEDLIAPTTAKVALGTDGRALLFSRTPIPFLRNVPDQHDWLASHKYYKHIGIYAYRTDVLARITQLPLGILEQAESLEQLRWLENGYVIKTAITEDDSHGIDTPADVDRVLAHFWLK